MEDTERSTFQAQLVERRQQLKNVRTALQDSAEVHRLLREVDNALERLSGGSFGVCDACHEPIEKDRLAADPLTTLCIDHLTRDQRSALEDDLSLASRIQTQLLPSHSLGSPVWKTHYQYEPAGPVSGDYCDLIAESASRDFLFLIGDVSGKGVAASLLMSNLHAIFRTLSTRDMSVTQMVHQANRLFCENTMPSYFATLVCGRAWTTGEIELCNAGHCSPLIVTAAGTKTIDPTGVPLGLFCDSTYTHHRVSLEPGEALFLYTDGLTEARNAFGEEYGEDRLSQVLAISHGLDPRNVANAVLSDLKMYLGGALKTDDLTLMVLERT